MLQSEFLFSRPNQNLKKQKNQTHGGLSYCFHVQSIEGDLCFVVNTLDYFFSDNFLL